MLRFLFWIASSYVLLAMTILNQNDMMWVGVALFSTIQPILYLELKHSFVKEKKKNKGMEWI